MQRAPTYRERLQTEGLMLAVCGGTACLLLFLVTDVAGERRATTIRELAILVVLIGVIAPLVLRAAISRSIALDAGEEGDGRPRPLWQIAAAVAVLVAACALIGGASLGVRAAGACVIVGFGQAILLATLLGIEEREAGRRFYRLAGSRLILGPRLGAMPAGE